MDMLVDAVFSLGTVVMMGMKTRSTPARASSWMWPCTSFAGKQMVSDATWGSPSSNMARVDGRERRMANPSERSSAFQNGMVSQNARTRGMPMVTPRSGATCSMGQSWKRSFWRASKRFSPAFACSSAVLSAERVAGSFGSPTIWPRGQRFPVTKAAPSANVITVRLQWLAQNGQVTFAR